MKKSLGLLEIKGLASAIVVADTMAKTASVTIVGIESCKGGGWQTIKVVGDVAAVQAALSSGSELAKRTNSFIAMKTLSRPDQVVFDTWGVNSAQRKAKVSGVEKPEKEASEPVVAATADEETTSDEPGNDKETYVTEYDIVTEEVIAENQPVENLQPFAEPALEDKAEDDIEPEATCNLCNDPLCPRVKGEPHSKCIHNTKVK